MPQYFATEDELLAEVRKHVAYWQGKLRLRDVDFPVTMQNDFPGDAWICVERNNGGENPNSAAISVRRSSLSWVYPKEVWEAVCHELVHVILWPMDKPLIRLSDQVSMVHTNLIYGLIGRGAEVVTYKLEQIFCAIYAADSPPEVGSAQLDLPAIRNSAAAKSD